MYGAGYRPLPEFGGSFGGACGECCSFTCPGGRICDRPTNRPWRCFCNSFVAVDCEQVCIPKECADRYPRSCSGFRKDCGCRGYLSCQQEAPGEFYCLPTGKFMNQAHLRACHR